MIRVDLTKRTFEKKPSFMEFMKDNGITQQGEENAVAFKVVLKGASWGRDFEAETNTDDNKIQFSIETEDGKYRDYLTIYRFKRDGKWNGFATSQLTGMAVMLGLDLKGISSTEIEPDHFNAVIDKKFAITAYLDEYQGKIKLNMSPSLADWEAVNAETSSATPADDLL